MDFAEAFDAPIVEKISGSDVAFPIIPVATLAKEVGGKAKLKKKALAQGVIKENNLWGEEKLLMLKDASTFYVADLENYCNTVEGAVEVIRLSLAETPKEEVDEILKRLEPYQTVRIAMLVSQFATLVDVPKEKEKEEDPEKKVVAGDSDKTKGYGDQ